MSNLIVGNIDISPLFKVQDFLSSALQEAETKLEKAGAIQAFELCYELAWKTMKRILSYRGIEVASPREVFRAAAQEQLIKDLDVWFEFIRKRNMTVHIYNEKISEEIFHALPEFSKELGYFIETIKALTK